MKHQASALQVVGVPPGAYDRTNNFMRFVITPALLEVNGLSDMGVRIDMARKRHCQLNVDHNKFGQLSGSADRLDTSRSTIYFCEDRILLPSHAADVKLTMPRGTIWRRGWSE